MLEKLDEVRRIRKPQGMIPHLYSGGLPHAECMSMIRLFGQKCLPEMKSWPNEPSTIDPQFARDAA